MVEGASKIFEYLLQKMHSYQTLEDLTFKCSLTNLSSLMIDENYDTSLVVNVTYN
jgi:hypothetical protein